MDFSRRSFFQRGGATLSALSISDIGIPAQNSIPDPFADLKNLTAGIARLTRADYEARLEQARKLMVGQKIDLLYLNGGTSMEYFTGIRWGLSERMFAVLIPARGNVACVCPKFEEGRGREQVRFDANFRTWEEDESPYNTVRQLLQDLGIASGTIAIEPTVRHFIVDGLQKACAFARFVNGEPISQGCRMTKTRKEIDYMQLANKITKIAYEAAFRTLRPGMTAGELSRSISMAHGRLGAPGGAMVNLGPASAFPHGSVLEQVLKPGDVVLVDGGCRVEGYQSDVTRTVIFGKPSDKHLRVWGVVKKAQDAALAAARPGAPCEAVDIAARRVITEAGFGPGYKYFTHRVGHGIGLDGHEFPYLVMGNKLPLRPGMTFSNEPGIYIVSEFGLRIEDCIYITEDGARFFGDTTSALVAY